MGLCNMYYGPYVNLRQASKFYHQVKELTRQQSGKEYLPTNQKYKCELHQRRRPRRNGCFRRLKRGLVVKFFRLT